MHADHVFANAAAGRFPNTDSCGPFARDVVPASFFERWYYGYLASRRRGARLRRSRYVTPQSIPERRLSEAIIDAPGLDRTQSVTDGTLRPPSQRSTQAADQSLSAKDSPFILSMPTACSAGQPLAAGTRASPYQ